MTRAKSIRRATALTAIGSALLAGVAATSATAAVKPPACKITDFTTTLGPVDAGAGQRYASLNFTAIGTTICVLSDDLTGFQFLGARGVPLPTAADAPGSATTITIGRGAVGHLDLHWTVMDGKPFVPTSLIFTTPAGDGYNAAPWTGGTVSGAGHLDVANLHL